jgi:SAM-dependent methyltransferase
MSSGAPTPLNAAAAEADRVRERYARRPVEDARYSWLDPAHLRMYQGVERQLAGTMRRRGWQPGEGGRMLEIGCGGGHWLRQFVKFGLAPEQACGVDLLPARVQEARRLGAPGIGLACAEGSALPFHGGSFVIVLQATMFSSILDQAARRAVAEEMARVTARDGLVLSYDFCVPNPANPDVRPVTRADLAALFPGWRLRARRVTLAPPLARRLAGWAPALCGMLEWVPFLRAFLWAELTRDGGQR